MNVGVMLCLKVHVPPAGAVSRKKYGLGKMWIFLYFFYFVTFRVVLSCTSAHEQTDPRNRTIENKVQKYWGVADKMQQFCFRKTSQGASAYKIRTDILSINQSIVNVVVAYLQQ